MFWSLKKVKGISNSVRLSSLKTSSVVLILLLTLNYYLMLNSASNLSEIMNFGEKKNKENSAIICGIYLVYMDY